MEMEFKSARPEKKDHNFRLGRISSVGVRVSDFRCREAAHAAGSEWSCLLKWLAETWSQLQTKGD